MSGSSVDDFRQVFGMAGRAWCASTWCAPIAPGADVELERAGRLVCLAQRFIQRSRFR
jgi:hypothetical protein